MINIGNSGIKNIYVGSQNIKKVYVGSTLVWPIETKPTWNVDYVYFMICGPHYYESDEFYDGDEDRYYQGTITGQQSFLDSYPYTTVYNNYIDTYTYTYQYRLYIEGTLIGSRIPSENELKDCISVTSSSNHNPGWDFSCQKQGEDNNGLGGRNRHIYDISFIMREDEVEDFNITVNLGSKIHYLDVIPLLNTKGNKFNYMRWYGGYGGNGSPMYSQMFNVISNTGRTIVQSGEVDGTNLHLFVDDIHTPGNVTGSNAHSLVCTSDSGTYFAYPNSTGLVEKDGQTYRYYTFSNFGEGRFTVESGGISCTLILTS